MNDRRQPGKMGAGQSGVMLLEALIAILIFSLGILTVIGIQATSIRMASDAQLRSKAALLADRLVGQMWASGEDIVKLEASFKTGGNAYNAWLADVKGADGLPGIDDTDEMAPRVNITPGGEIGGIARDAKVVITLFWRTPSMSEDEPAHQHIVTSYISRNP
ncbi:MAG: hypothetical protein LBI62_01610 [Candidatus Accumulibacter sp.]|jgi:type IV pilus assembly protein PilV|nr:hypothetical protein [Accumulibacter sp.]